MRQKDNLTMPLACLFLQLAMMNAAMAVKSGEADLVLAGGMESMSQAAFSLSARARWGYKFMLGAPEQVTDTLLYDGLTDPLIQEGMGAETEQPHLAGLFHLPAPSLQFEGNIIDASDTVDK